MTFDFLDTMNKKQALFVAFLWTIVLVVSFLITLLTKNNPFLFIILAIILAMALIVTGIVAMILLICAIIWIYNKLGNKVKT